MTIIFLPFARQTSFQSSSDVLFNIIAHCVQKLAQKESLEERNLHEERSNMNTLFHYLQMETYPIYIDQSLGYKEFFRL